MEDLDNNSGIRDYRLQRRNLLGRGLGEEKTEMIAMADTVTAISITALIVSDTPFS